MESAVAGTNELALAYNSFIREWKKRASGASSQAGTVANGPDRSMCSSSDIESCRRFWAETISQGSLSLFY